MNRARCVRGIAVPQFPLPIGLLLFNRPEYASRTLGSLKVQTMGFDERALVIVLDGYAGSKDEFLGRPDRTAEVFALAVAAFPRARMHRLDRNYGIGLAFDLLEAQVFATDDSPWALFLEEDFVLYPMYLEAIDQLVALADPQEKVAVVSATGDVRVPANRANFALHPQDHLWAFALRRSHHEARTPLMQPFLEGIAARPYWQRDDVEIARRYRHRGMVLRGSSQDFIKRAILTRLRKISLTTTIAYGEYIGQEGEHFDPESFRTRGFHVVPPAPIAFEHPGPFAAEDVERLFRESRRNAILDRRQAGVWQLEQWRQKMTRDLSISLKRIIEVPKFRQR